MDKDTQNLKLILLDKCTIQSLNSENLKIVSKHKILVPDIVLIENLKRTETVNKLSKLGDTYWVEHWSKLARNDLLGQKIEITQDDLKGIIDDSKELKKQVKLAKKVAKEFDKIPQRLLQTNIDLSNKYIMRQIISEFKRLYPNVEIPDHVIETTKIEMKSKRSIFNIAHNDWESISQLIINELGNKPIRPENRHLKESDRTFLRNNEWLEFACGYFQTTDEQKAQIFKRWEEEKHQNLKYFAPYAYYILALELTIGTHIIKSKGNHKLEIMRDMGYLYYAHFTNVTFHTCDHQLKKTIEKIPFLKRIQEKMVWFYNDEVQRPGELNRSDWLKTLKNTD